MNEQTIDRQRFISTLMKIGHGDLNLFVKDALPVAQADPHLFGHTIVWNQDNGKVKDSKVAYPVLALRGLDKTETELAENAIAAMCNLAPRELYRSYLFSRDLTKQGKHIPGGHRKTMQWAIQHYLKVMSTIKHTINLQQQIDQLYPNVED